MNRALFTLIVLMFGASAYAEDHVDLVKKGNDEYRKENFSKALEYYHSAETELPASSELEYNIAGALHQQGKYEETVDRYTKALNSTDISVGQRAHYNLGNTYYRTGEFDKAITSYQKALDIDPDYVSLADPEYTLSDVRWFMARAGLDSGRYDVVVSQLDILVPGHGLNPAAAGFPEQALALLLSIEDEV